MKLITTDKLPHVYETLRGSEGSWTVSACLEKDGARWNWSLRVYHTDADGIRFEQGLWIGNGWTKAESRQELERELAEQINKAPWIG